MASMTETFEYVAQYHGVLFGGEPVTAEVVVLKSSSQVGLDLILARQLAVQFEGLGNDSRREPEYVARTLWERFEKSGQPVECVRILRGSGRYVSYRRAI